MINTDTYPDLPPPPAGVRKAPFTPEPPRSNTPLRDELIVRHEQAFREVLSGWDGVATAMGSARDAAGVGPAMAKVKEALAAAQAKVALEIRSRS